MKSKTTATVALITPPFLQPNGPYAATPFLAAALMARGHGVVQYDLSLEALLRFFSGPGLVRFFDAIRSMKPTSPAAQMALERRGDYERTIEPVIRFLQGRDPQLARRIVGRKFLPEGPRFEGLQDDFGLLEISDGAAHLAALYLDDLHDLAVSTVLPGFGLARYQERIAASAPDYGPIAEALASPPDLVEGWIREAVDGWDLAGLTLAGITVPFPGNLMGALLTARHLKRRRPDLKIALGGGWVSTELRDLSEPRIFDLVDHVILDEGEGPLLALIEHLTVGRKAADLIRTFRRVDGKVVYSQGTEVISAKDPDPTPNYLGLPMDRYFTVLENINPVMRLWAERGFVKLRAARGCYHKKCTFCDVSLPYIADYRPQEALHLAKQAGELLAATGNRALHFVDEALPAGLMARFSKQMAQHHPGLTWWGNVRFDRSFTPAVCRDLAEGGCVAVSGGLEGLLDSVLLRMKKGSDLGTMVRSLAAFRDAGILVHAYMIYGFPPSSIRETVEALEVLRQLFAEELVTSAYWHRFALTVHSPVYADPGNYGIAHVQEPKGGFARNEAAYVEKNPEPVDELSKGLKDAAWHFMHGLELGRDVRDWFDFPVPKPKAAKTFIRGLLK